MAQRKQLLQESEAIMSTRSALPSSHELEIASAILNAAIHKWTHESHVEMVIPPRAFVTVSREPGAGAISFSHRLAQRLNEPYGGDWTAWDKELIDKVSAEQGIAKEAIEAVELQPQNWLAELLEGLTSHDEKSMEEFRVYKRIATAIRALSGAGHTIIVGRGGQFVTANMPGAIHIRLVAPLEYRIKHTATHYNLTLSEAAKRIASDEKSRKTFYHRYWSNKALTADSFTMTLNAAELSVDELVECVIPVIRLRETLRTAHPNKKDETLAAAVH
jgi:cytidylate kinase